MVFVEISITVLLIFMEKFFFTAAIMQQTRHLSNVGIL